MLRAEAGRSRRVFCRRGGWRSSPRRRLAAKLALSLVLVLSVGCSDAGRRLSPTSDPAPPDATTTAEAPGRLVYVLSGYNVGGGFEGNALTILEADGMRVRRRVALRRSWARSFSRDPEGNLWVGFSGSLEGSDNLVQVFSPGGELLHTLEAARDPEAGISFAAGRAFVACAESGFEGSVVVFDLRTLRVEKTIRLSAGGSRPLLLASSAADADTVLVAGATTGPSEGGHTILTAINPRTLAVESQTPLGANTDIWRILPHRGRFYLLNVDSYAQPRDAASDLLVFTPGTPPKVEAVALAPAPLWGALDGDALYAYHNPEWNSTVTSAQRTLSRLDLGSGEVRTWGLPDNFNASDLAVVDGAVVFAVWGGEHFGDGLHRFDPDSGRLSLLVAVRDASRVLTSR